MPHQKLDYERIIRQHGGRVTPQRVLILDAICAGNGHTTFGEILARIKSSDSSIDRSTLYRALDFFTEIGLVVSADTGLGEPVYEIKKRHQHHHLICLECGAEQEVDVQTMTDVFNMIQHRHAFHVEMDHLVLFGICSGCQSSPQDSEPLD
jgi:Fur family ferric uptake transcriptional regulator